MTEPAAGSAAVALAAAVLRESDIEREERRKLEGNEKWWERVATV